MITVWYIYLKLNDKIWKSFQWDSTTSTKHMSGSQTWISMPWIHCILSTASQELLSYSQFAVRIDRTLRKANHAVHPIKPWDRKLSTTSKCSFIGMDSFSSLWFHTYSMKLCEINDLWISLQATKRSVFDS